jgi:hypothetical protein
MVSVKPSEYSDIRIKFAFGNSSGSKEGKNTGELKIQARVRF